MSYVFPTRQMLSTMLQSVGLSSYRLQLLLFLGCFYFMTATAAWAKPPVKKFFATSIGAATPVSMCPNVVQTLDNITITEGVVGDFTVSASGDLVLDFGVGVTIGGTISIGITRNGGDNSFTYSTNGSKLTINYIFNSNGNPKVITISGLTVTSSIGGSYQLQAVAAESNNLNDLKLSDGDVFATATVHPAVGTANINSFYGPDDLFVGETSVFAVDAIANATQYQWTTNGPMGTVSQTTNVPFITLGAASAGAGTVTVKGISTNSCEGGEYTHNITVKAVGLKVNNIRTDVCADGSTVTLPDITISEQFFSDFKVANSGSFSLEFNELGFTFAPGSTPKATFTSPSSSGQSNFTVAVNTTNNTLDVTYNIAGSSEAELNTLVISGVQVNVTTTGTLGVIRFQSGFNTNHFTGITNSTVIAEVNPLQGISRPTFNSPPTQACTGQPLVITINNASGASGYNWKLPNGIVLNSFVDNGDNTTTFTFDVNANAQSGNIEIQAYNSSGCVSVWEVMNGSNSITVQPGPVKPSDIVGPNELCLGSEALYHIPAVSGADGYEWHISSKLSSISDEGANTSDTIINTTTNFLYIRAESDSTNAVPVKVRALKTGCTEGEYSNLKNITINDADQIDIIGVTNGQAYTTDNAPINLSARLQNTSVDLVGGIFSGDGVSGSKFYPGDIDASAGAVSVPITYTYQVPNAPCPSVARVTVIVSKSSGINGINSVYCQGTDTTINFNVRKLRSFSPVSTLYIEALLLMPDGQGGQAIQSRSTNLGGAIAGTLLASQPPNCSYGGAPAGTNNDSLAYTFNPKGLAPGDYEIKAVVYNDFTLLFTKGDVLSGPTSLSGSTNDCRPSTQTLARFKILATPASALNKGSVLQSYCADGLTEYTLSVPRDTTINYAWEVVDGGSIVGRADSNVVVVKWDINNTDVTRNIRLTENRATCAGSQLFPINVKGVPNPQISSSNSPSGLNGACARSQVTYGAINGATSNYTWTAVNGRVVSGQGTAQAVIEWFDNPNAELIIGNANANGCIGYDTLAVTINSASAPNLQGPKATCANTKGVVYTISAPGSAVIQWSVSGHVDTTTSTNKDSLIVNWGNEPVGKVSVQKTLNGCVGSQEIIVEVNPLPVPSINNVASVYCNTQTSTTFVPVVNGDVTLPAGTGRFLLNKQGQTTDLSGYVSSAGVLAIDLLSADNNDGGVGTYELSYKFTNDAGCVDTSAIYNFDLISKPTATFTGLNATYCANGDFIRLTSSPAGGVFTINELDNNDVIVNTTVFNAGQDSLAISALNGPGKYNITYTYQNSNGCQDISDAQTFNILTLPVVTVNGINIQSSYCVRDAVDLSLEAFLGSNQINSFNVNNSYFEVKRVSGSKGATEFEKLVRTVNSNTTATNLFSFTHPIPSETALANTATTSDWNQLAGTYQVRFIYVDGNNCAVTSNTQNIVIDKLPEVDFSGLGAFYCSAVNEVLLTPTVNGQAPTGGTGVFQLSADGVSFQNFQDIQGFGNSTNRLKPSKMLPGDYYVRYVFNVTNGCVETTAPKLVKIGDAPQINFSFQNPPANNKYCVDGTNISFLPDSLGGFFTITKDNGGTKQLQPGVTSVAINTLEGEGSYDVTYTYTDASGCTGTSDPQTFRIVPLPSISVEGLNNNAEYCVQSTNPIVLNPKIFADGQELTSIPTLDQNTAYFEIKRVGGVNGFMRLVKHGTDTLTNEVIPSRPLPSDTVIGANATTDEWNARAGEYAVRYTYRDVNGCQNISPERIITLTPLPSLSFTGLSASYCDDVELVTLTPFDGESRITSSVVFKYRKLTDATYTDFTQGNSFSPKDLGAGEYEIILESGAGGCQNASNRDSVVTVTIEPTPKNIRIVASRDYNQSQVSFSATADGVNNSWTWSWDFKDGTTSQEQNPTKQLATATPSVINYELIPSTELGCNASVSKRFKIDFDLTGHCVGGVTQFTNLSELPGDTIGNVSWDFGDGQGTSTEMNPGYTYQNPGTYWVTLSVQTTDGVATYKLRRRLDIFPVVTVNTEQFYVEGFENGTAGWISHGVVEVDRVNVDATSWTLKNPDGFVITNPDGNAWVTDNRSNPNRVDSNANYNNNEQSYVESPCFDIGGLNKPMISFSYWSDTDLGGDGVSLLYTIDDGKTWHRLGTGDLGINWYNTKPILGAPGTASSTVNVNSNPDSQGWSGKLAPVDGKWQIARYSLTEVLIKMEAAGITNRVVRFRMSFGSNADNTPNAQFDGFAFDNIIISNRNRLVLLEYFINTGINNAAQHDLQANNFPQTGNKNEIVKIHHHTAFPAVDSLNEVNPKDPSARAFHHGIREVPRGIIDGYFRDTLIGQWTQDIFADRTLIPAPFKIDVANATTSAGQLNISTEIKALLAFDRKIVINVVVVDSAATAGNETYYNVTRKMLPDAAGTYRSAPWALGDTQKLDLSWDYGNLDPSGFKVVVFIEDYETKEIWQAGEASVSVKRQQEGQTQQEVTGVEDELLMEGAVVYPNPTTNRLNVAIKAPLSPKAQWQIWSVTGRLVKQGSWTQGKRRIAIDVQDLAGGLYILRVADKGKTSQLRFEKH